jgi:hypothetical protein
VIMVKVARHTEASLPGLLWWIQNLGLCRVVQRNDMSLRGLGNGDLLELEDSALLGLAGERYFDEYEDSVYLTRIN